MGWKSVRFEISMGGKIGDSGRGMVLVVVVALGRIKSLKLLPDQNAGWWISRTSARIRNQPGSQGTGNDQGSVRQAVQRKEDDRAKRLEREEFWGRKASTPEQRERGLPGISPE